MGDAVGDVRDFRSGNRFSIMIWESYGRSRSGYSVAVSFSCFLIRMSVAYIS